MAATAKLWRTAATTLAAAALLLGTWYVVHGRAGWHAPSPALRLKELNAEVFFLQAPALVRVGPTRLVVVRIAGPAHLVPHTYLSAGLDGPRPIEAWARLLQAPLVFNAGQFDAHLQHLGWLKARGTWLSKARKPAWMGLLVSGPRPPSGVSAPGLAGRAIPTAGQALPWAQVVDLSQQDAALAEGYDHVLQSMMLLDDAAQVRVRRSETAACRTIVAQDKLGRLLIVASEGAITLHDLANWLPVSNLQVVRAMNLDGGSESQLAVVTPEMQLMLYGQYGSDSRLAHLPQAAPTRTPLPAVVAVYGATAQPPVVEARAASSK